MVTVPAELRAAQDILQEEASALANAGPALRMPEMGMMVEVPAAAIAIDLFDAAFFSIGSNDLTQYVTAAGRDVVRYLFRRLSPDDPGALEATIAKLGPLPPSRASDAAPVMAPDG